MALLSHWFLLINVAGQLAGASSPVDPDFEREQVNRWMQFYTKEATKYEITLGGDAERKLELRREPVIRWTNPVIGNGSTHGACFVWTYDGRAEAFASIFSYIATRSPTQDMRRVAHAFNSFSLGPLVAARSGERFWYPEEPGIDPQPIPDAPQPTQSRPLRVVQMRNLARQFRATSSVEDNTRELRLIPQPLYRYEGQSTDAPDGGVFCFVTGTDPELLLLIESRKTPTGTEWCCAAARHSHCTLRLYHQEKEVWSYVRGGPHTQPRDPKHRYLSIHGISVHDKYIE